MDAATPDLPRPDQGVPDAELIQRVGADADVSAWLQAAQQEKAAGRAATAKAILRAAAARFPDAADPHRDRARLAEAEADWADAARHWRAFLRISPAIWWGHTALSHAERQQGRLDEAASLITAALHLFPEERAVHLEATRVAEARRDPIETLIRWKAITDRFPGAWEGWIGLAWASQRQGRLPDAEATLAHAHSLLPGEPRLFTDHAQFAELRRDWPAARSRWTLVTERFPTSWQGLCGQARVLRAEARPEDAKRLLIQALERFPAQIEPVLELARLSEAQKDWLAAERWWRVFSAFNPEPAWAHAGIAAALRQQGRIDAAERHLAPLLGNRPADPVLLAEHARCAEGGGHWDAAMRRWARLEGVVPGSPDGYRGQARAASRLHDTKVALEILRRGHQRLPADHDLREELAHAAGRCGAWAEAEDHWRHLLAADAGVWWRWTSLAQALREQRKASELETVLATVLDRFAEIPRAVAAVAEQVCRPHGCLAARDRARLEELVQRHAAAHGDEDVLLAPALLARERQDWDAFRQLVRPVALRFPDSVRTRLLLAAAEELAAHDDGAPDGGIAATRPDPNAFLFRYESLGADGTGGCEFGLVQRRYGCEPLGLLRWASIEPSGLVQGLQEGFERLGDIQTLTLLAQLHDDWQVRHAPYGIRIDHTHLDRDRIGMEEARRIVHRRMVFLADKLIADLKLGEKTFVYRVGRPDFPRACVAALAEAIRRYGDGRLLFVYHSAEVTGFEIESDSGGVVVAALNPAPAPGDHLAFGAWHGLCRALHAAPAHRGSA